MKQLNFFSSSDDAPKQTWQLFVDGAARNNPGPAGAGVVILKEGQSHVLQGCYLGTKTNNQAEYLALILGLLYIRRDMPITDRLEIKSDSQLLVRQLMGQYATKHPELRPLKAAAIDLLQPLTYTIQHIPREENAQADKLANQGIDKKIPVPLEFLQTWRTYDTSA